MSQSFFSAGANKWVTTRGPYTYPPGPSPPGAYPVFDPSINRWISAGNYGGTLPGPTDSYFSFLDNAWVTGGSRFFEDVLALADQLAFWFGVERVADSLVMADAFKFALN
jgi:hypothetical protein